MKRTLGLERLFSLGNFKNIKVIDIIENLPQELMTDIKVVTALRNLQLAQTDKVYLNYLKNSPLMNDKFDANLPETIEEAIETVDEIRINSLENLKEAFASQNKEIKDE